MLQVPLVVVVSVVQRLAVDQLLLQWGLHVLGFLDKPAGACSPSQPWGTAGHNARTDTSVVVETVSSPSALTIG